LFALSASEKGEGGRKGEDNSPKKAARGATVRKRSTLLGSSEVREV